MGEKSIAGNKVRRAVGSKVDGLRTVPQKVEAVGNGVDGLMQSSKREVRIELEAVGIEVDGLLQS